jgi:hypothetical protein
MSIYTRGDKNNSLDRGFVGSIILAARQGCRVRAGRDLLTRHRGRNDVIHEGPAWSFLPVSSWCLGIRPTTSSTWG